MQRKGIITPTDCAVLGAGCAAEPAHIDEGESLLSRAAFKFIVEPVFGWLDCAGGVCTGPEAALKLAGAPLTAANFVTGGGGSAVGLGIKGMVGAGEGLVARELGNLSKDLIRASARDIWKNRAGKTASEMGLQVHHRIPLEYAHLFSKADPNRVANLVGVQPHIHDQITAAWNA